MLKFGLVYRGSTFFLQGCYKWIQNTLNEKLYILGAVAGGVAGIEVKVKIPKIFKVVNLFKPAKVLKS